MAGSIRDAIRGIRDVPAADAAGYFAAVLILVGGGAIFTSKILDWLTGPGVAIAAVLIVGWLGDRLGALRARGKDSQ